MYNNEINIFEDEKNTKNRNKKGNNKKYIFKIFTVPAFCLICLGLISLIIHVISYISTPFADFFNEKISSVSRRIFAAISGLIPFSLGETIVILCPFVAVFVLIFYFRKIIDNSDKSKRFLAGVLSLLSLIYSLFVINFGTGYRNSSLDKKLNINKHGVTAKQLYDTLLLVNEDIKPLLGSIYFKDEYSSSSMPFSLDEMVERINDSYSELSKKYSFIPDFRSKIKVVALSDIMTYTHVSGVYSYFTGESNLNINFPDYTLVYTTAHEFAHQRGISREDEANFVAFLVCTSSDDVYIRYCGYQNMIEYLLNALYTADQELYFKALSALEYKTKVEISSFNSFFDRYNDSVASKVSSTVNNVFLYSQGISEGEKSYGMVVDLCVAYYENLTEFNEGA